MNHTPGGPRADDRTGQPGLKVAVLAEGLFAPASAKTAIGVLRYAPYPVVAVIDSTRAGMDAAAAVGTGAGVPIVPSVADARARGATALLIGTAAPGGRIPDSYRPLLAEALAAGLDVWNGLHERVLDDERLAEAARRSGASVRELRDPPHALPVGGHRVRRAGTRVVLTVGSDAAVGKMTATLELLGAMRRRGASAAFVATGQTGIAIAGSGISVDAVVADFIAGAAERLVCDAAEAAEWVLVEGQGALTHPGFSGVTLGLLHGSVPDLMVLCHDAARTEVKAHPGLPLRALPELVRIYEDAGAWARHPGAPRGRVVAVAVNTRGLGEAAALAAIARASDETGLVAADPVREGDGAERLAATVLAA